MKKVTHLCEFLPLTQDIEYTKKLFLSFLLFVLFSRKEKREETWLKNLLSFISLVYSYGCETLEAGFPGFNPRGLLRKQCGGFRGVCIKSRVPVNERRENPFVIYELIEKSAPIPFQACNPAFNQLPTSK